MKRSSSLLILLSSFLCLFTCSASAAEWPGEAGDWNGYQRFEFKVDERACFVVVPKQSAAGNPWVWRARFPSYHAEADVLLLQRGFHVAHINTGGMLGSPRALNHWDAFYELMTEQHGLAKKPALEAVSRGGLFAYRWASRHPQRVACIYADTPVCDIKSWPLGQGKGVGSEGTWKNLLTEFGFTQEQALAFEGNPIDVLAPIAEAKVPLLHIVSLSDRVVPPDENTFVLAKRYRELGGSIDIIEVAEGTEKSKGHHFTHPAIERVANFIEQHARQVKVAAPATLAPSLKDVAYAGDHPAQVLDVYQADSTEPTPVMVHIHGGGWRGGSKAKIPAFLSQAVSEGWLSVVSVEYRFTDVAIHPAQVNDCMRAVKFVRANAKQWNLDPERIGVTGGSAGAHLSLWLALHDDAADPKSEDPIARQSSRVSCAISFAGPTDWKLLSEIPHAHPAYRQLLGYEPGTPAEEMDAKKKASVSPITFASVDDPPILLVHGDADTVVPIEHAQTLDVRIKKVGGDSELLLVKDGNHNALGSGGQAVADRSIAFIKEHLLGASAGTGTPTQVAIVVGPSNHAPATHEVAARRR